MNFSGHWRFLAIRNENFIDDAWKKVPEENIFRRFFSYNTGQNIWQNLNKQSKVRQEKELLYLFFCNFLQSLPKCHLWRENWTLGSAPTQFWNYSSISWFPKLSSLKLMQPLYKIPSPELVLKHSKLPKYYDQGCRYS